MADIERRTRTAALIVFILYFVIIISPAGVIYFKNGEILEGEIKKHTEEQVGVQAGKNFFYVSRKDIDRIEEKEYFRKDPDINWLVVGVTAGLSVLMFSLAIWGREI